MEKLKRVIGSTTLFFLVLICLSSCEKEESTSKEADGSVKETMNSAVVVKIIKQKQLA